MSLAEPLPASSFLPLSAALKLNGEIEPALVDPVQRFIEA
jgi:hypothetical protein